MKILSTLAHNSVDILRGRNRGGKNYTSFIPSGFGFVTFEHEEPAEKVCSIQYHDIKGKKVEVKVAQTKEALAMQQGRGRVVTPRNYGN